jgi:hypothetical protein
MRDLGVYGGVSTPLDAKDKPGVGQVQARTEMIVVQGTPQT